MVGEADAVSCNQMEYMMEEHVVVHLTPCSVATVQCFEVQWSAPYSTPCLFVDADVNMIVLMVVQARCPGQQSVRVPT
jgi:hypothetical protein